MDPDRAAELLGREVDPAYRRRALWLLAALELEEGQRLLDAGCGMGTYLRLAGSLVALEATGVDGDVTRLREARRARAVPAPHPARVARADLLRLPFADGSFDRVLCTEVLEHIEDDAAGLGELFRVLKPGGVLAVSVPHADYPFWWDPLNATWTALGGAPIRSGPLVGIWWGHERLYRPGELAERVAAAGFAVENVEEATHHSFPFAHFLVYGVGKPLLEAGLLPAALARSAARVPTGAAGPVPPPPPRWRDPVAWVRGLLGAVDRRNEALGAGPAGRRPKTFVNVLLKARRPRPSPPSPDPLAPVPT